MPYRFEISKTSRAGCQNKECKDAGVKIQRGELRYGTLVTINEHDSWQWRHWGCITPKQVENLLMSIDGDDGLPDDLDIIDGYEDVGDENQAKIRTALRHGHVPDEDWKGDVECNRPGAKGFRKRTPKKKTKDNEADAEEGTPTKPKAKKSKSRKAKTEGDDDGDDVDAPEPKNRKTTTRPKKKSGHLAPLGDGADVDDEDTKPAKKSRAKKRVKEEIPEEEDEDANGFEEEMSPEPARKKRRTSKKVDKAEQFAESSDPIAKPETVKKIKGKKAIKVEEPSSEQIEPKSPIATEEKPAKTGLKRVIKAIKEEELDELGDVPTSEAIEAEGEEEGKEVLKSKSRNRKVKGKPKIKA